MASLEVRLLHRTPRGVSASEAGEAFVAHARTLLQQADRSVAEVLPAVLSDLLARHPTVTVDLQERLSLEIVRALHEGVADIGVVAGNVPTDGLETLPYTRDRLVLATSLGHRLAAVGDIRFADALEHEFVGLDTRSPNHAFMQQVLAGLGRSMRLRIRVGSFDAMCRMIEAGVGIGVLPETAARRHARSMAIAVIQQLDE